MYQPKFYGTVFMDSAYDLMVEMEFLQSLPLAQPFTRERIIYLMMQGCR